MSGQSLLKNNNVSFPVSVHVQSYSQMAFYSCSGGESPPSPRVKLLAGSSALKTSSKHLQFILELDQESIPTIAHV